MKPYELRRAIRNCASYHGHASAKEWGKLLDYAATQVYLEWGICEATTLMTPSDAIYSIPYRLVKNMHDIQSAPEFVALKSIDFYPHEYKIGNGRIRIRFSAAAEQNILVIWPNVSCTGKNNG